MAIYLDNAATSFPKPPQVAQQMSEYLLHVGATINRSVYGPAQEAGMVTLRLRERLCRLLGYAGKPTHAILTAGCTMSLNLILQGCLRPGDHCLISAVEHNAVMRPLVKLAEQGVEFDRIPCDENGFLKLESITDLLRPNTKLVLISHASNVSGCVQDAAAVGKLCREHGIFFALDCAQTAGEFPVDFDGFGCDAMAVPAHKGLLGPGGIGALLLSREFAKQLQPVILGGTGSASHTEYQPESLPDKFEPGTANLPGIYGWEASSQFLEETTVQAVRRHGVVLMEQFLSGLQDISGVGLVGTQDISRRVPVFSLDFMGQDNALAGDRLEREFGILSRCGLHCAPNAHKTFGTYPGGTVRLSFGYFTTADDVDAALAAIRVLADG